MQIALLGRACLEGFAAGAGDGDFVYIWMNFWFHYFLLSSLSIDGHIGLNFKRVMIGARTRNRQVKRADFAGSNELAIAAKT